MQGGRACSRVYVSVRYQDCRDSPVHPENINHHENTTVELYNLS